MHKKGFTLSETLIVLAIMGVIAAISIPILQNNMPDRNKLMIKKSYGVALQAINNIASDEVNYPSSQTGKDSNGVDGVMRIFNYTDAVANKVGSTTYNKFCYLFFDQLNVVSGGPTACPLSDALQGNADEVRSTKTVSGDGVTWYMFFPSPDNTAVFNTFTTGTTEYTAWPLSNGLYNTKIIVDVNGSVKGPNCTSDTGVESFANVLLPSVSQEDKDKGAPTSYTFGSSCTKPDTYIIGVRYDGKVETACTQFTGTAATCTESNVTDPVVSNILKNPMDK